METKKKVYQKWWFWVICAVVVLGAIGAALGGNLGNRPSGNGAGTAASTQPPSVGGTADASANPASAHIDISATDLVIAYDENTVAADNEYEGNLLRVTGTVKEIGKDILGRAYVMLQDERNAYAILGVQCYFNAENEGALAALSAGDQVTIVGKCTGEVLSVQLEDCDLA